MSLSHATPQSSEWNALALGYNPNAMSLTDTIPPAQKDDAGSVSVLFVCLGNICRSPMAEAVFRALTASHPHAPLIDSAGTGAYHAGDQPDPRTLSTLADHGINNYSHEARKIQSSDFTTFDYILAMDQQNLHDLQHMKHRLVKKDVGIAPEGMAQLMLFGDFGGKRGEQVGDPYYGARNGFDVAYEQMVRFSNGFIAKVIDKKPK